MVSPHCELLNVFASQKNVQRFLYRTYWAHTWFLIFKCVIKWYDWEKDLVYWGQVWGFSPVWTLIWVFRFFKSPKLFIHNKQPIDLSSVWTFKCDCKWDNREKDFVHWGAAMGNHSLLNVALFHMKLRIMWLGKWLLHWAQMKAGFFKVCDLANDRGP